MRYGEVGEDYCTLPVDKAAVTQRSRDERTVKLSIQPWTQALSALQSKRQVYLAKRLTSSGSDASGAIQVND